MERGVAKRTDAFWRVKPPSTDVRELSTRAGISIPEAQVLINRGIRDEETLRTFLSPRLSSLLDPMILKDMDRAVSTMVRAIERREPITIFGDYDADGLTATAVLYNFLRRIGTEVSYCIPNRLTEGYGLSATAVRRLTGRTGLLVTVDCGISNQEEVRSLQGLGMEVIVTDHHQIPEEFNPSCAVINPLRTDCPFTFKMLSGVGLAFFLAVALRSGLREKGWFQKKVEPDLREYLDLVALGTVADMVPLLNQNRILVRSGLERMGNTLWPGIRALSELSKVGESAPVGAEDLSFRIAPRLNACGRMGDAETGIRALTTDDPAEARRLAAILNELNDRRQSIERQIVARIEEGIRSSCDLDERRTLVFAGKGWHRGVLGIVASRIAEKYCRPTVVLDVQDGLASGSARSIDGFDLYGAISSLKPLLSRFGGHTQAAGLSLQSANIEEFRSGLEAIAQDRLEPEDLVPTLEVDGRVELDELDLRMVERLQAFGPFGRGNPEPVFYTPAVEIVEARRVGEKHLRFKLRKDANQFEGIGFGLAGRIPAGCGMIDLVYTPAINRWQGLKRLELKVLDLQPSNGPSKLKEVSSKK